MPLEFFEFRKSYNSVVSFEHVYCFKSAWRINKYARKIQIIKCFHTSLLGSEEDAKGKQKDLLCYLVASGFT